MAPKKSRAAHYRYEFCPVQKWEGVVESFIRRSLWAEPVFSTSERSKGGLFRREHRGRYPVTRLLSRFLSRVLPEQRAETPAAGTSPSRSSR